MNEHMNELTHARGKDTANIVENIVKNTIENIAANIDECQLRLPKVRSALVRLGWNTDRISPYAGS